MSRLSMIISLGPLTFSFLTGLFFMVLPIILDTYLTMNGLPRAYELPFKSEYLNLSLSKLTFDFRFHQIPVQLHDLANLRDHVLLLSLIRLRSHCVYLRVEPVIHRSVLAHFWAI